MGGWWPFPFSVNSLRQHLWRRACPLLLSFRLAVVRRPIDRAVPVAGKTEVFEPAGREACNLSLGPAPAARGEDAAGHAGQDVDDGFNSFGGHGALPEWRQFWF